jgi:hypothetical protein
MNEITKKTKIVNSAEKFVREVLEESFGQKANKKTVRTLAEQVSRSIPTSPPRSRERA